MNQNHFRDQWTRVGPYVFQICWESPVWSTGQLTKEYRERLVGIPGGFGVAD